MSDIFKTVGRYRILKARDATGLSLQDDGGNEGLKINDGGGVTISITEATFANTGLHVLDTNATHDLIIKPGSDLTADRILTLTTGDAARTVTLSGDPTLADWFDQSVKTTGNVQHATLGLGLAPSTGLLHIKPGTATAGTAPIKLTSGTLLGTPEAGAIEFNNDSLYYTQTTGPTRKVVATSESATFVVSASDSVDKEKADYVCDGTDDQVQIKAAIDALLDTGGRVILLEGTYYINNQILISDLVNNNYVTLEGQGYGTLLKIPDGHSSTLYVIHAYGSSTTLTGIQIKNLRIDGNRSNVTGAFYDGVAFNNVTNSVIEGVYLSNGKGNGAGDGYGYWLNNCTDITIRNCVGRDWDYEPMEIRGSSRILVTGSRFEYRIELYDTSHYITFTNNLFVDMQIHVGTNTGGSSYCNQVKINDNYFYTVTNKASGYGIVWLNRARQAEIIGNQFYINNTNGNGISADDSGFHLIANNYFYLGQSNNTAIYNNLGKCNIVGNFFYHAAGNWAIVAEQGTYGNISNNYAYNPDPSNYGTRLITIRGSYYTIKNNYSYGAADAYYIEGDYNELIGNKATGNKNRGVYIVSGADNNIIRDNIISGTNLIAAVVNSGSGNTFSRNIGYTTENSGIATISSENTYIDVSHGLAITPSINNINVTQSNNLGNATKFWVSDVGASTFRINVDIDPGVTTATFVWQIGSY